MSFQTDLNTKEKLIKTIQKDIEEAKKANMNMPVFRDLQIIVEKLADVELPDLEGDRKYWLRWVNGGYMIYTHVEVWDHEHDCWSSTDTVDVLTIPLA